jgi:antitoxin PrlF
MATAHSRVTAQGQISVPARIRQKLGLAPGSVLEWDDSGDDVLVRRAGRYSSEDIHQSVFPAPPKPRTLADLKDGVRRHVKRRHARR